MLTKVEVLPDTAGRHGANGTRETVAIGSGSLAASDHPIAKRASLRGSNVPDPAASEASVPIARPLLDSASMPDPIAISTTPTTPPSLLDPALCFAADVLDDLERVRIANENRLRQLTRTDIDKDGEERGFGLDESHPDVARLAAMVDVLKKLEHEATLELQRKLRKHPLGGWIKAQRGIGEKQGARLLAAIGDPYINAAKNAPRTVSALWAYCGLHVLPVGQGATDAQISTANGNQLPGGQTGSDTHAMPATRNQLPGGHESVDVQVTSATRDQHRDINQDSLDTRTAPAGVAAKRRKGQQANWSTKAKMRAYLVAESCIKQLSPQCRDDHFVSDAQGTSVTPACACSPYRVVYDKRREHTAVTHPEWTDGHSHQDGLRVASKEILKDLWIAARELHGVKDEGSND